MIVGGDTYFLDIIQDDELTYWYGQMTHPRNSAPHSNNGFPELDVVSRIHRESLFINDAKGTHLFIFAYPREMLGFLTITDRGNESWELGFRILDYRKRNTGIMSEVLPLAIPYVITSRKPREICAIVAKDNVPAERILTKNGFTKGDNGYRMINGRRTRVNKFIRVCILPSCE